MEKTIAALEWAGGGHHYPRANAESPTAEHIKTLVSTKMVRMIEGVDVHGSAQHYTVLTSLGYHELFRLKDIHAKREAEREAVERAVEDANASAVVEESAVTTPLADDVVNHDAAVPDIQF